MNAAKTAVYINRHNGKGGFVGYIIWSGALDEVPINMQRWFAGRFWSKDVSN